MQHLPRHSQDATYLPVPPLITDIAASSIVWLRAVFGTCAGSLPRESRTSIREGQATITQDMLSGRQRRSASMQAAPTALSGHLPAAVRRASVATSHPLTDAATPFQPGPAARSSFVGGGMPFHRTVNQHFQPPMQPSVYHPAPMQVTGTMPDEQGFMTAEHFLDAKTVRRPSRAMHNLEATSQTARTASYADSSIALEPSQHSLYQVGVYEALATDKQSLTAPHTQEDFASYQMHEESMAQQPMPAYPAPQPADRRDSLADAQSQQSVMGFERVQAGRRESVVGPPLHQNIVGNERMYEEMQFVPAVPQSPQVLARPREGSAAAFVPQAGQNIGFDEWMNKDVHAVPQSQQDPQLQVQTSRRPNVTAAHMQHSLGISEQAQDGSRGRFAALHLQQSLPNSEQGDIAAPQVQRQPRQSRLSRAAQPQGELLQARAASLPPRPAHNSPAAVRRASAPINALPNIPEEPPAALGPSIAGKLFSTVRTLPHCVSFATWGLAQTDLVDMLGTSLNLQGGDLCSTLLRGATVDHQVCVQDYGDDMDTV